MASNELNVQPAQDGLVNSQKARSPSPGAMPETKSSVYIDPFAKNQNNKFQKGDIVHMSIVEHGTRRKGTFTVVKTHYNRSRDFYEYQLSDGFRLYDGGAWVREKELRLEKARE